MVTKRRDAISKIDDEIAALTAKRSEKLKQQREEIGRICERAGLLDIPVSDDDLEIGFKDLAARFRKAAEKTAALAPSGSEAIAEPGAVPQYGDRAAKLQKTVHGAG